MPTFEVWLLVIFFVDIYGSKPNAVTNESKYLTISMEINKYLFVKSLWKECPVWWKNQNSFIHQKQHLEMRCVKIKWASLKMKEFVIKHYAKGH